MVSYHDPIIGSTIQCRLEFSLKFRGRGGFYHPVDVQVTILASVISVNGFADGS